jgi:hypothetical protein
MKITPLLLATLIIGLVTPNLVSAQVPHQRDAWYIGFGLGGALSANWNVDGQSVSFDDWLDGLDTSPKIALNFKVGGTLSPKTLLGFDLTAVAQGGTASGLDAHVQINNYFLMLTHFPYQEGLLFRLGGGYSNLVHIVDSQIGDLDSKINGAGALVGIGYAFWLLKSFNLTVNLDYSQQWYSSDAGEPDRSNFAIAYVGFDWY